VRIVVACDSFKGSLSAPDACAIVAAALREGLPEAAVMACPMADGGEGTAETLVRARGGRMETVRGVSGPLPGQRLDAGLGWLPETATAVVEMAAASGLELVPPARRNPLHTHTFGTGELIRHAIGLGARQILLTLGGSATVDGGTGAARALGWQFLDRTGRPVTPGGGSLADIASILPPDRTGWPEFQALCDVTNPLCGATGAAAVFGPQKGATPPMVEALDRGLRHLAERIRRDLGIEVLELPGGGAAGGFGAGAVAFLGARLVPGALAVAEAVGLPEALRDADWVVTGEGCLDHQSFGGKAVCGVRNLAREAGVRVAVVAGRVELTAAEWRAAGIEAAVAAAPPGASADEARRRSREWVAAAARRLAREALAKPA